MKRLSIASAVLVVSLVAGLAAQAKPSFTGSWKLSSDPGGDAFISPTMAVAQDEKVLTVTTTGQFGELKTTYNVDGTEGKSPLDFNGNTIDRTSKLAWDGDKMVLTTTSDFGGDTSCRWHSLSRLRNCTRASRSQPATIIPSLMAATSLSRQRPSSIRSCSVALGATLHTS